MKKTLRAVFPVLVSLCVLGVAACGGHATSPTAPSVEPAAAPAPSPAPGPQGATIMGTVAAAAPAGMVVAVAGTSASAIVDAAGHFTLNNVPPADVVLTFSAPGVSASTSVGAVAASEVVELTVSVSGSVATVDAEQHTAPDSSIVASGTISDLDVAGRQFRLGSTIVQVPTSAVIKRADVVVEFSSLKNGDRVYVRGMKDGLIIRASEVLAVPVTPPPPDPPVPPPPPPPPPPEDATVNGVIAGLTGNCPALSMTVAGTGVKTSAATVFNNRSCAELRNGDTVYAAGPKQGDGTVLASKVYYVSSPSNEVRLTGTVSNLAGSCPAFSLTVEGTSVKTNSATTFDGTKGCSVIANGDSVTVVGTKQSDGSVLASKVTNATAPPPPPQDTYANGPIVGLTGTCPAISFSLSGTPVKTNAATTFNGRACAELKNGDVIYAAGPKQSDGSILANRTYYTAPTVTLTGTVSNFGGAWPVLTFIVQGTAVKTSSATVCDGTKGCSQMANGDSVTVVGTPQSDGSVLATKITNATAPPPPPPQDTYVNGPIVGLAGTCPAISFSLSGTPVKTNAATTFNGRACAELKNGDVIYAAGPKQSDGSILANRTFYTAPTVTLSGTVSNFGGAWPALTFTVQGKAVKTSSATTCDGTKGCSLMANGDSVTVVGTEQSDGSVLASKVTNATAPPPTDTTLNGVIAGLGGTCPALVLTVGGGAAKTNAATVFTNKTCAELKNGDTVYAIGPKQSDGSVLASKVYFVK